MTSAIDFSGDKAPCVVSTFANITLSGEQTIGSTSVVAGNRVLVRSQTDLKENGIYIASASAWPRATDWNNANDVGTGVICLDTANNIIYHATFAGSFSPGTTEVTFTQTNTTGADNTIYMRLSVDNTVTQSKLISSAANTIVFNGAADWSGATGLYLSTYALIATANSNISAGNRPGVLYLSTNASDLQYVYWNGSNWKRPSDGGNANA